MCMPVIVSGERSGLLRKYYEDAKYHAAFDRCVDVMAQLMQKYGNRVLEQQKKKATIFPIELPGNEQQNISDEVA